MSIRKPLQKQLLHAWEKAIASDYCNRRINSERSLQASFWAQLNEELNKRTRRMFIEPGFVVTVNGATRTVYPDIVICNTRNVIAVIEIKYQPRIRPSWRKDIRTLAALSRNRKTLQVANSRYRGSESDTKAYPFAEDVLFVWAGVHRPMADSDLSNDAPLSSGIRSLKGCFLELHAVTSGDGEPTITAKSR